MPDDSITNWFGTKLKRAMGEKDMPPTDTPEQAESKRKATAIAMGPRYQVHDASVPPAPLTKGSISAIGAKAQSKRPGSVANINRSVR